MNDVENNLRAGLDAFAAETISGVSRPPIASIVLRADAEPERRRQWPRLAAAIVAATVVTTGAAAAGGVLPAPVESTLREFREWGFGANQGAERMAWVTTGDRTYEVWRAPLDGGGQCVYDRHIGPDGEDSRGGSHCHGGADTPRSRSDFAELGYPGIVSDNSNGRDPESAWSHSLSSGQLPLGAAKVVFEFDDGTTLSVSPQREGYFITTFPGVQDDVRIKRIVAVDGDGDAVAIQPVS